MGVRAVGRPGWTGETSQGFSQDCLDGLEVRLGDTAPPQSQMIA